MEKSFLNPWEYYAQRISDQSIEYRYYPARHVHVVTHDRVPIASIATHLIELLDEREKWVVAKILAKAEKKYCSKEQATDRLIRKHSGLFVLFNTHEGERLITKFATGEYNK